MTKDEQPVVRLNSDATCLFPHCFGQLRTDPTQLLEVFKRDEPYALVHFDAAETANDERFRHSCGPDDFVRTDIQKMRVRVPLLLLRAPHARHRVGTRLQLLRDDRSSVQGIEEVATDFIVVDTHYFSLIEVAVYSQKRSEVEATGETVWLVHPLPDANETPSDKELMRNFFETKMLVSDAHAVSEPPDLPLDFAAMILQLFATDLTASSATRTIASVDLVEEIDEIDDPISSPEHRTEHSPRCRWKLELFTPETKSLHAHRSVPLDGDFRQADVVLKRRNNTYLE